MVIEINKDIDRYQESVAMGLTAKQLIFSIASVVIGGGLVYLLYPFIGLTGAAYVAIPVVAPIALGGFYSYNGMSFYEVMGKKFHYMFGNRALQRQISLMLTQIVSMVSFLQIQRRSRDRL